jgi:Ni/Co efflux regulator RcnB
LLVSWCVGGRCGMTCSDEDHGNSRRPGAKDRGWSHRSDTRWTGDQEVGWPRVRPAPCMWRRGAQVSWLSLKINGDGL